MITRFARIILALTIFAFSLHLGLTDVLQETEVSLLDAAGMALALW